MTPWIRCAFELRIGEYGPCRCGVREGHTGEHVCPHGYGLEIFPGTRAPGGGA